MFFKHRFEVACLRKWNCVWSITLKATIEEFLHKSLEYSRPPCARRLRLARISIYYAQIEVRFLTVPHCENRVDGNTNGPAARTELFRAPGGGKLGILTQNANMNLLPGSGNVDGEPVTSPALTVSIGILVLILFAFSVAAWIVYVPLSASINAPGEVIFQGKRQAVQHLEGGIVRKIFVKNGDSVTVGQPLIELENAQVQPLVNLLEEQSLAEAAQSARLEAESSGAESIAFPTVLTSKSSESAVAKIMTAETSLFNARRQAFNHQLELIRLQISQIRESMVGTQERLNAKRKEVETIEEQLAANQTLHKEGYVSRTVILDLQRVLAERVGEREALASQIASEQQRIQEFEQRIVSLKAERVQGAINELKQSAIRRIDLQERVRPVRDTLDRQVIRAPVTGKVVALKVATIGGVVMPRDTLMEIAPTGDELMVEARIRLEDIGEVKVGQTAEINISGLDRRTVPPLKARITYISDDRIIPASAQAQAPYYAAYLEFDKEFLAGLGQMPLMPGMNASVAIAIRQRTPFDYMIGPVMNNVRKVIHAK